ncbi:MAG: hypothetical protein PHI98_06880, partial [Eubacteriales bacterium]|nr:hypothetical protein [Eubacteriales bacterium]
PLLTKLRFMLKAAFTPRCYHCLETALVHAEPVSPYGQYKPETLKTNGKANKTKKGKKKNQKPVRAAHTKKDKT